MDFFINKLFRMREGGEKNTRKLDSFFMMKNTLQLLMSFSFSSSHNFFHFFLVFLSKTQRKIKKKKLIKLEREFI